MRWQKTTTVPHMEASRRWTPIWLQRGFWSPAIKPGWAKTKISTTCQYTSNISSCHTTNACWKTNSWHNVCEWIVNGFEVIVKESWRNGKGQTRQLIFWLTKNLCSLQPLDRSHLFLLPYESKVYDVRTYR